ncbi:lipoprotein [Pantoea sp. Aalb]|nr:hypothetical protein [Pantoea sp. Aalb]
MYILKQFNIIVILMILVGCGLKGPLYF